MVSVLLCHFWRDFQTVLPQQLSHSLVPQVLVQPYKLLCSLIQGPLLQIVTGVLELLANVMALYATHTINLAVASGRPTRSKPKSCYFVTKINGNPGDKITGNKNQKIGVANGLSKMLSLSKFKPSLGISALKKSVSESRISRKYDACSDANSACVLDFQVSLLVLVPLPLTQTTPCPLEPRNNCPYL